MMTRMDKKCAGFSLIEVTLALLVTGVGLLAVYGLLGEGMKYNRLSVEDTILSNFAHDTLGTIRTMAMCNWGNVNAGMSVIGLPDDIPGLASKSYTGSLSANNTVNTIMESEVTLNYILSVASPDANTKEILLGVCAGIIPENNPERQQRFDERAEWFYTTLINPGQLQ